MKWLPYINALAQVSPQGYLAKLYCRTATTLSNSQTKSAAEGKSIAFFDYDPAFSFEVSLRPLSAINSQTVDGGKDGLIHFNAVAITSGLAPSLGVELTIYQLAHYGGGLFLPFRDDTNGAWLWRRPLFD